MKILLYLLSTLIIGTSIFMILNYESSGRMYLIAGTLISLGLVLNCAAFFWAFAVPDKREKASKIEIL